MSVFLSAGHSDVDPGAVAGKVREADIAVDFRNLVAYYLKAAQVPYTTDGTGKTNWPLSKAAAAARKHDLAVEFHCNAAANPRATGVETLSAPNRLALGQQICEALARSLGLANRGAKPDNAGQHARLAFVQAGGIIVELFFLSNPGDLAAYNRSKWVAAGAVAQVLKDYLK